MRKNLRVLISAMPLIIGGLTTFAAPVFAESEEKMRWTVDELMEIKTEFAQEFEEKCGGDQGCRFGLYDEKMEDGRMVALEAFNGNLVMVTAINPERGMVKLYYRAENGVRALTDLGSYEDKVEYIYVVWLDEAVRVRQAELGWMGADLLPKYAQELRTGMVSEGVHVVVAGNKTEKGEGWFPVDMEVEMTGLEGLSGNTTGKIYVAALSEGNSMIGNIDYSSCFTGEYVVGMECRLTYGADGRAKYLPFEVTTEESGVDVGDNMTDETDDGGNVTNNDDSNAMSSDRNDTMNSGEIGDTNEETGGITSSGIDGVFVTNGGKDEKGEASSGEIGMTRSDGGIVSASEKDTGKQGEQVLGEEDWSVTDDKNDKNESMDAKLAVLGVGDKNTETKGKDLATPRTDFEEKAGEFPWWAVVLAVAGVAVAVWWFMPLRKKN